MSIIRRGPLPTDHFTIISNDWTRDAALTWEARGLLTWLAGHASGHDVTEDTIVAAGPAGRRAVRTMITDLEKAGYLRRDRRAILTGGSTVDYVLTDPGKCRNSTLPKVPQQHPRDDQGEQAEFDDKAAGQGGLFPKVPQQHPRSSPENQKKNKTPSVSTAKRGTRVPDDFQPDEQMRAWFKAEGIGQFVDGRVEHERFMDYWRGVPGVKGSKLDWPATWRNWMRSAADRSTSRRPVSAPPGTGLVPANGVVPFPPAGAYRPSTTDQRIATGLALAAHFREEETK